MSCSCFENNGGYCQWCYRQIEDELEKARREQNALIDENIRLQSRLRQQAELHEWQTAHDKELLRAVTEKVTKALVYSVSPPIRVVYLDKDGSERPLEELARPDGVLEFGKDSKK